MVNKVELNKKIDESGLKINFIIDKLDISGTAWNNKVNNKTPFRRIEEYVLVSLLPFSSKEEIDAVLHAPDIK